MAPRSTENSTYYDSNGRALQHGQHIQLFVGGPTQQTFHGPVRELSSNYVAIDAEEDGSRRSSTNHNNATIIHA